MKVLDRTVKIGATPEIFGDTGTFTASLEKIKDAFGVQTYKLSLNSAIPARLPKGLSIQWRLPSIGVKGEWSAGALYEKRIRADWEASSVYSRVSVNAPVICLFGNEDENIISFACSDVVNTLEMEAPVREEDDFIYCQLCFFTEKMPLTKTYQTEIRVDTRQVHFSHALADISDWWASYEAIKPATIPQAASFPVYSTWYSYHQNFTAEALLEECRLSSKLGYKTIIIDDGWQTMDAGRGYDYTGDWEPERITKTSDFVEAIHQLGMKCMFWYSVPFCGKKSNAYQQFRGKFLTENHHWAPVFDPRYPEVRAYLINKYAAALINWNLDGFKLDFIDEFRTYPETILTKEDGRDYASVDAAVDRLLTDVMRQLKKINPDVLIEFRQKYIGPAMRKYGNMFRAFDCPNDVVGNRMRTTDVRLLSGNTVVHSDMITWHTNEPVAVAALQFANILFSVPQLSVRMNSIPRGHSQMIAFYTKYWEENKAILLEGEFIPFSPLANYPILSANDGEKVIYGVYENQIIQLDASFDEIHFINGKMSEQIAFEFDGDFGSCEVLIYDCMGNIDYQDNEIEFEEGLHALEVPSAGIIIIKSLE